VTPALSAFGGLAAQTRWTSNPPANAGDALGPIHRIGHALVGVRILHHEGRFTVDRQHQRLAGLPDRVQQLVRPSPELIQGVCPSGIVAHFLVLPQNPNSTRGCGVSFSSRIRKLPTSISASSARRRVSITSCPSTRIPAGLLLPIRKVLNVAPVEVSA
jgi:hypothetical protein